MDRTRLLLIGIVALVLSAALSYVVYQRLQAKLAPQKVGVDVVVAANDIQIGAKIGDRDLKVVKYSPEDLPPRVFHTKTSALGRGTVLPIGKGEFVVPDKLAAENAGAGVQSISGDIFDRPDFGSCKGTHGSDAGPKCFTVLVDSASAA